jgi:hypothetical protein
MIRAISNPQAIATVYDDPKVLDQAKLHRLAFREDGPIAVMTLALHSKPSRLPARWSKNVNATIIELDLVGLSSVLLSAWTPGDPPRVTISKGDDDLVTLAAEDKSLHIVCQFVRVRSVEGYCWGGDSSCYR